MPDEITIESLQAQLAARDARLKEVNDEAKGHRLNASEARKAAETAEASRAAAETAAAERIKQIETEAGEKLTRAQQIAVKANLRIAAKEAGASDPNDMLALIPADKMKINDDGEIENADALLAEMKKAKPYLFGGASTSSTNPVPKVEPPTAKQAKDMTADEYQAAKAALLKR